MFYTFLTQYDRFYGYDDGNDVVDEYDDDGNTEDNEEKVRVGTMRREMMMAAQERLPSQKGAVSLPLLFGT